MRLIVFLTGILMASMGCSSNMLTRVNANDANSDRRLKYLSETRLNSLILSDSCEVRFDHNIAPAQVRVNMREGIEDILVRVLGKNRANDWRVTLVKEHDVLDFAPWYALQRQGNLRELEKVKVSPGDIIILSSDHDYF